MKLVLITGGAGFIGSNLAIKLINEGYKVRILDLLSCQVHGPEPEKTSHLYISIKDKVDFIRGSVCSADDLKRAIIGVSYIIHLAAETGTGQSMYEIDKYSTVNIGGTSLLMDLIANSNHDIERIIIASSRAIYGEGKYLSKTKGYVYPLCRSNELLAKSMFDCQIDGDDDDLELVATDEESKIHPTSVYGITKQVQEQIVLCVCNSIGIEAVALRYQNVFGPGQSLRNPYTGILSIFSTNILNNNSINIFEDGKESRDFIYIDDVIDATFLSLTKPNISNQTFNVGTGIPIDVLTVAQKLIDNFGINVPIKITGQYRLGDIRHNYASISKINNILGFTPKWTFEEGIKMFVNWVKSQDVNPDLYSISIDELKSKGLLGASDI